MVVHTSAYVKILHSPSNSVKGDVERGIKDLLAIRIYNFDRPANLLVQLSEPHR